MNNNDLKSRIESLERELQKTTLEKEEIEKLRRAIEELLELLRSEINKQQGRERL